MPLLLIVLPSFLRKM